MEYQVVYQQTRYGKEEDVRKLEEKVNELIKQGWKPQGGICTDRQYLFCQAMVK